MKVDKNQQEQGRNFKLTHVIIFLFLCLFVLFGKFTYKNLYESHTNNHLTRLIASFFYLPAGEVNGEWIYLKDIYALDLFAIAQNEQDHYAKAIEAVVRQELISQLLDEINEANLIDDVQDLPKTEVNIEGWDDNDYYEYITRPYLEASTLEYLLYDSQKYQKDVEEQANKLLSLLEAGANFADLAYQYSQGASSSFGGEVGDVCLEELDEEFISIWDQDSQHSPSIVEQKDKYSIVLLEPQENFLSEISLGDQIDILDGEDEIVNKCTMVRLWVIELYKNDLADVLDIVKQTSVIELYGS